MASGETGWRCRCAGVVAGVSACLKVCELVIPSCSRPVGGESRWEGVRCNGWGFARGGTCSEVSAQVNALGGGSECVRA